MRLPSWETTSFSTVSFPLCVSSCFLMGGGSVPCVFLLLMANSIAHCFMSSISPCRFNQQFLMQDINWCNIESTTGGSKIYGTRGGIEEIGPYKWGKWERGKALPLPILKDWSSRQLLFHVRLYCQWGEGSSALQMPPFLRFPSHKEFCSELISRELFRMSALDVVCVSVPAVPEGVPFKLVKMLSISTCLHMQHLNCKAWLGFILVGDLFCFVLRKQKCTFLNCVS